MAEVLYEVDEHRVALITLDAPERRNAMNLALVDEMVAAVERAVADEGVGAVVVTGAGSAFCAGAALGHLADGSDREGGLRRVYEGFLSVARCPLPTVAAVNGPAVGAGMNLALACDVRIASVAARFEARFLDLGLHPGGGHTWMLERLAGPQTAAAAVLFGEALDGEAAVQHGVAWRCVPETELLPTALYMAGRAASMPRELSVRTKETLQHMPLVKTHDEAVDIELAVQAWSTTQPEFRERLAKFSQKK
jgi:enoyl-CoA hydratase